MPDSELMPIPEKHPIYNLSQYGEGEIKKRLYGNLCMAKDLIGRSLRGEDIEEGDIILIKNIGAYSISESKQFIKPKAKVVSLGKEGNKIVRREESFEDRYKRDFKFLS
ncbi:MAG: hypothetical protein ABEK17_03015, partial [Candidatus Aenigmatarchaeota archaeon]